MVSYIDLKKAVNTALKKIQLNGQAITITSQDVTEGFLRPSFFVQMETTERSADENNHYRVLRVTIYYFPTDRYEYSVEVLKIQEALERVFDLKLRVNDRLLNIQESESMIVDGVLNFMFDVEFYDGREYQGLANQIINIMKYGEEFYNEHPVEVMEELETKIKE